MAQHAKQPAKGNPAARRAVDQPDVVVKHRPKQCSHCQQELAGIAGEVVRFSVQGKKKYLPNSELAGRI